MQQLGIRLKINSYVYVVSYQVVVSCGVTLFDRKRYTGIEIGLVGLLGLVGFHSLVPCMLWARLARLVHKWFV